MRLVTVRLTEKCKSHAMTSEGAGGMKFINSLAELLKRLLDYRYTVCVCVSTCLSCAHYLFFSCLIERFTAEMSIGTCTCTLSLIFW